MSECDAEPSDRERPDEDRSLECAQLGTADVPHDKSGDGDHQRQLDVKRHVVPLIEAGRHRDPVPIRTAIAISVPKPNRRAIARSRARSPGSRSDGTTAATRKSCPPTKNAMASRCR